MKYQHIYITGITLLTIISTSCQKENLKTPINESQKTVSEIITYDDAVAIPGQYIVILNDAAVPQFKKELSFAHAQDMMLQISSDILSKISTENKLISQSFAHTVKGFVTQLQPKELALLQMDPRVKYIEQDQMIILKNPNKGKPGGGGGEPDPQSIPWGITSVGGSGNGSTTGKTAWIIDSGIDLNHSDLNVDISQSISFLSGKQSTNPDDQNGHGTHVAGTIGAIDNSIGVVGVAAGVPLVSVRVLDRRGSGSISGVISGVNYVGANASSGDVANMSLGGGISATLDQAVLLASANGIYFVIAAGNSSTNANNSSPARVNGTYIYTISALDNIGDWASFSNYGNPPIDYCAPGVNIPSTYKNNGYTTLSGTSMAAPHVSGILIMGAITNGGYVSGDPDGQADPIAHR